MREIDENVAQFASTLGSWQRPATSAAEIARAKVRPDVSREATVRQSRKFALYDPISVRTVQLHQIFILGRGLTFRSEHERTQEAINAFLHAPANRAMFSYEGMAKSVDDYYVDGERAIALFRGQGRVKVRRLDPLQIFEIVTNPEDEGEIWGYKRDFYNKAGHAKKFWYWDVFAPKDK
ncbi:MAG: hypothetical protein V1798_00755, partial [Pseudomonadota bacterium]